MLIFLFIYQIKFVFYSISMHSFIALLQKTMNLVTEYNKDETYLTSMKLSLISPRSDPAMSTNLLMWHNF